MAFSVFYLCFQGDRATPSVVSASANVQSDCPHRLLLHLSLQPSLQVHSFPHTSPSFISRTGLCLSATLTVVLLSTADQTLAFSTSSTGFSSPSSGSSPSPSSRCSSLRGATTPKQFQARFASLCRSRLIAWASNTASCPCPRSAWALSTKCALSIRFVEAEEIALDVCFFCAACESVSKIFYSDSF